MNTVDQAWANLQSQGVAAQPKKQSSGSDKLGQDQFMQLMLAQLKNQDPLKPMSNGDFIAQLAQFSTVSGVKDLQKSFSTVASSLQSNQALQASALIGRTVSVPSDTAVLPQGGNLQGQVQVPASSSSVTVEIKDGAGQLVKRLDLGQTPAGQYDFSWDGLASDGTAMPAGSYSIAASAVDDTGSSVALNTYTYGDVQSVDVQTGGKGVQLNLAGLGSRAFSDVQQIK